jgi:hypothetical protein
VVVYSIIRVYGVNFNYKFVADEKYHRRELAMSACGNQWKRKDGTSYVTVEYIMAEGSAYEYWLTGFLARKRKSPG